MGSQIDELQDFKGPLKDLKRIVDAAVAQYGPNAIVEFDAGFNNVSVIVVGVQDDEP